MSDQDRLMPRAVKIRLDDESEEKGFIHHTEDEVRFIVDGEIPKSCSVSCTPN